MIIRFIRNRIVLATIFLCSLTYFIIQTQLHQRFLRLTGAAGDLESPEITAYRAQVAMAEEMRSRLVHRHIQWMKEADKNVATSAGGQNGDDSDAHHHHAHAGPAVVRCRNTKQGKRYITDEFGFICERDQLLTTGCCNHSAPNAERYSCSQQHCDQRSACCEDFEHCASCCLSPIHSNNLYDVISRLSNQRLQTFLKARDPFDMCLIKCRTSSSSVTHESRYKNGTYKYCYRNEPDL